MKWNIVFGSIIWLCTFLVVNVKAEEGKTDLVFSYGWKGEIHAKKTITSCDPPAGDHPNKKEVCEELDRVDGNLDQLNGESACPTEYHSVRGKVVGFYKGKEINWEDEFANTCERKELRSGIFNFE